MMLQLLPQQQPQKITSLGLCEHYRLLRLLNDDLGDDAII